MAATNRGRKPGGITAAQWGLRRLSDEALLAAHAKARGRAKRSIGAEVERRGLGA